jgi:hypothetical protein
MKVRYILWSLHLTSSFQFCVLSTWKTRIGSDTVGISSLGTGKHRSNISIKGNSEGL